MQYLLNADEMKKCDRATIEEFGMPSMVLMERAAMAVVDELMDGCFLLNRVMVICGSGNNGGDGFAVARLLKQKNIEIAVLFAGKEESLTEDAKMQKKICENYGINICSICDISEYTCIVDAIFGVGLSREIRGTYRDLIKAINDSKVDVLAVDMPSGISADTGNVMGIAVKAKKTVTFAFMKLGQVLYPGTSWCGDVIVKDIGITKESLRGYTPLVYSLDRDDLHMLPSRLPYSNKGTYGKALLAAGQHNMCGAACLAAEAAYRMGTGLVRVFTEECNRVILQNALPEALLTTYEAGAAEQGIPKLLLWASAIGIGPGLGTGREKGKLLEKFLQESKTPLVLDADALNLVADNPDMLKKCRCPVIITPHIGEMSRLTHIEKDKMIKDLPGICRRFAAAYGVICVLKDSRTIVSDGSEVCINQTGCNGMATGGSGDVLTGIITGLLAQGMRPFEAAKLSVWIHGKAGEIAAKKLGDRCMLAGDIIRALPVVLNKVQGEEDENV